MKLFPYFLVFVSYNPKEKQEIEEKRQNAVVYNVFDSLCVFTWNSD